jgi:hypothetical protein
MLPLRIFNLETRVAVNRLGPDPKPDPSPCINFEQTFVIKIFGQKVAFRRFYGLKINILVFISTCIHNIFSTI